MGSHRKTSQLQIRVSPAQKTSIQRAAKAAGMDMSTYVLVKLLPEPQSRFNELTGKLVVSDRPAFVLAELNDFLSDCTAGQFDAATGSPPPVSLSPELANHLAAMVEYGAGRLGTDAPSWVRQVAPLERPVFGSDLESLRLYLLSHSPAPFRRRNIFVDASLGHRV